MVILTIAGVWALVMGQITLTRAIHVEGRRARYYGVSLLVAAWGALPLLNRVAAPILPAWAADGVGSVLLNFVVVATIVLVLALPFRSLSRPPTANGRIELGLDPRPPRTD